MPTTTKTVTVTLPERAVGSTVTINRKKLYLDDQSYEPLTYTAQTNGSRVATFVLPVPDDATLAAEYEIIYLGPANKQIKKAFQLAQGSAGTIEAILSVAGAGSKWSAGAQLYAAVDARITALEDNDPQALVDAAVATLSGIDDAILGQLTDEATTRETADSALGGRVDTLEGTTHAAVTVADTTSIDLTLSGQQISAAANFGTTAGTVAQGNHAHTGVYDPAGSAATAQAAAVQRANHTGTQSADTVVDGTTNKAYTATEQTKLAGIATGATANATNAQLRDRSTHTGTQTLATISDAGTIASQSAASVTITGGSVTGITDLTVADGGTGASTASGARTNLGALGTADTAADSTKIGGITITGTPSTGYVPTATSSTAATWQAASSGAPVGAKYIVQTADSTLTNEQALSALSTGLVKVTTTTGVLSTATASDVPDLPASKITSGNISTPAVIASGLTGATAASRYVGATTSGAPSSGTFAVGDFAIDQTGKIYVCTTAGTPGTWTQVGGGSSGATNIGDVFYASQTASVPSNSSTPTVITSGWTEAFDTASWFTPSTGKFQPTVACYCTLSGTAASGGSSAGTTALVKLHKNGSSLFNGSYISNSVTTYVQNSVLPAFPVYFNGSTDYVQLAVFQETGSTQSMAVAFGGTVVRLG